MSKARRATAAPAGAPFPSGTTNNSPSEATTPSTRVSRSHPLSTPGPTNPSTMPLSTTAPPSAPTAGGRKATQKGTKSSRS